MPAFPEKTRNLVARIAMPKPVSVRATVPAESQSSAPRPLCLSGRRLQRTSKGHLKSLLLGSVASTAMLLAGGGRALAECEPPNPGAGGTVTCSGTDGDGFAAPANTPVTINVQSGASVGGSGVNVSGSGDSFVNNDGTIGGAPSSVVFNGVAGFSKTLNNNGTLQRRHRRQRQRLHRHQPKRGDQRRRHNDHRQRREQTEHFCRQDRQRPGEHYGREKFRRQPGNVQRRPDDDQPRN